MPEVLRANANANAARWNEAKKENFTKNSVLWKRKTLVYLTNTAVYLTADPTPVGKDAPRAKKFDPN